MWKDDAHEDDRRQTKTGFRRSDHRADDKTRLLFAGDRGEKRSWHCLYGPVDACDRLYQKYRRVCPYSGRADLGICNAGAVFIPAGGAVQHDRQTFRWGEAPVKPAAGVDGGTECADLRRADE